MAKKNQAEEIMNAAIKLITNNGYSNVSLRDIANEAGVALSQLNYYYKNKEGMFAAVIKEIAAKNLKYIENALKSGESAKEKFDNLLRFFEETIEKAPENLRLLVDLTSMALWSDTFKKLLNSFYEEVAKLIETHVSSELNSKHSSIDIAKTIFASIYGIAMQSLMNPFNKKVSLNHLEVIVNT